MIRHPVLGAGLFIMKGTEVMGLLAGLAMHKRIPLTLLALALLVSGCGGPGGGTTLPSTGGGESSAGASQPSDWSTFGDGLARQGYNANETTLTSANVATLALQWKQNLGAAITAQSLYAAGVSIGGSLHDVLYIGTEGGLFYAIDAHTGAVLWQKQLGMLTNTCDDLESGEYGITDTATYDRATGRVYVVDGLDKLHALDMKSGKEISGWPVTVTPNSSQEHVYGALTYNPANHFIYVETASYCEDRPYQGRIVAVDTSSTAVVGTFLPSGTGDGGGIWGMGGASIDAATNDVFIGTGDDFGTTRHDDYAEHVIRFTPTLGIVAANYPTLVSGALDYDFGSTPMLFVSPGCPAQLSVKNKDGTLYVYGEDTIASGPLQSLEMADPTEGGRFIGVTTYSPATNMLYVGDPGGYGPYTYGIIALQVQPDCSLTLAWQMTEGVSTTYGDNIGATVANGVAYSNSGRAEEIFANDATTGALLWDSGTTIGGYAFAPPTVTAGHVYVGAWDDNLYAFGLP
jgi:outer membrane protein assembly factor BamB